METKTKAIARWSSPGGKYWVEIYPCREGYRYEAHMAGGYMGRITQEEAIQKIEARVAHGGFNADKAKHPLNRIF